MKSFTDVWFDTFLAPILPEESQIQIEVPKRVGIPDDARSRHCFSIGGTGAGKTRLIELVATGDVYRRLRGRSDRGWLIFDTQGDLYRNMRARLALLGLAAAEHGSTMLDKLLYLIDPTNEEWGVAYDLLQLRWGEEPGRKARLLTEVVLSLYEDDPFIVVRLKRVLRHTFLALILAGKSLPDIRDFLANRSYREEIVDHINYPTLTQYWIDTFPKSDRAVLERLESAQNRVEELVDDPDIADFYRPPGTIDKIRTLLDKGAFVLVHAPQSVLGEDITNLFCAFIIEEVFQAAKERAEDVPRVDDRRPFTLFCDEFQNYAKHTISEIVRESRKLRLDLWLATQTVVDPKRQYILDTARRVAGNIISFRVDQDNAEILSPDIFSSSLDQVKNITRRYQKAPGIFGEYLHGYDQVEYRSLAEIKELDKRKLVDLPDRVCYWKNRQTQETNPVEVAYFPDVDDLPDAGRLPLALARQEKAAFRLAGRRKFKSLPAPDMKNEHNLPWQP